MIVYDDINPISRISFSEEGDTLIIENFHVFGIDKINSFSDVTETDDIGVFFNRYFQYTVDGVNWSEWEELSNYKLSNINIKYNHIFNIRYKYIRSGQNSSNLLYFYSISLDFDYKELPVPRLYENSYWKKYLSFWNVDSIEWSVNILNKIVARGLVPKFMERGKNVNWEDEDFINFWWNFIYLNALENSYTKIFSDPFNFTSLVKKLLIQKDIIPGETDDLGRYYYLLTHYYDEIMKRGSNSIFDSNRNLPSNYSNIKVRGELLRVCNQSSTIESVFGIVTGEETGWIVGSTCPSYKYNDFYQNFLKAWELGESVLDLSKYPLSNPSLLSLQDITVEERTISSIEVNTSDNDVFAGILGTYQNSILVDNESDYEVSFKVKGLQSGNNIDFGVIGYNFLGNELDFIKVSDETESNTFINTDTLSGDLFFRGIIRYKSYILEGGDELNFTETDILKFAPGVERISPKILVGCNNDVYIYDIKIKNIPVTSSASFLLHNSELIIKLLEGAGSLSTEEIVDTIIEKLIPIHMIITTSERDIDSQIVQNNYLPYILPFNL